MFPLIALATSIVPDLIGLRDARSAGWMIEETAPRTLNDD